MSRALIVLSSEAERQRALNWINKAPVNTRVEFKAPKRSLPQNDRFWAMLTDVARQVPWHGLTLHAEDWKFIFLDALKREVRMVPNIDGNGFVSLGRSSSDLSKEEMSDLMELISEFGARHGVAFGEHADKSTQEAAQSAEGFSDAHVAETTETLSTDEFETADGDSIGVSAEGGEADAPQSAALTQSPDADPVEQSADPVIRALKQECIDNMLRDAFSDPKDQQAAKIDKMEAVFLEPQNLGAHGDFVKLCAETVRRIIGKPNEKARAREYLMGKVT